MDDIVLTIRDPDLSGGVGHWRGWTSVNVRKALTEIAGGFSLDVTQRGPLQHWRRFRPGQACTLTLAGQVALVGYVDEVSEDCGHNQHAVTLTGRSPAGDLVDCDCVPPWEYTALSLTELVSALIAPYGLVVRAEVDVGDVIERCTINPGDTVFSVIERHCRLRAVLCTNDPLTGKDLLLTRSGSGGAAPVGLVSGGNLLSHSVKRAWNDRHSAYLCLGQQENKDKVSADEAAGPSGTLTDPAITRYRPKVIVAEGQGDGATLLERAQWQLAVARAKSTRMTCTVLGWTAGPGGPLWQPNWLTTVVDDVLAIQDTLLIDKVTFAVDRSGGRISTLELVPPDAYLPEPGGTQT